MVFNKYFAAGTNIKIVIRKILSKILRDIGMNRDIAHGQRYRKGQRYLEIMAWTEIPRDNGLDKIN